MKKFRKNLLTFIFMIFTTNTHAADSYDLDTKILTIPVVVVNNITYSNVVLKLNNFDVLKSDPNPPVGTIINNVLYQFVSAKLQGDQLTITLKLTSQGADTKITFCGNNCGNHITQLTDDQGNLYNAVSGIVGNTPSDSNSGGLYVNQYPFVADIPTTVSFKFSGIASNATGIGKLTVDSYAIRNIPFQK